jgi:hypothetical protein
MREHVDHGDGLLRLVQRVVQQRGRHLHREGGADQRQVRHALRRARGASSAISEPKLWPTSAACLHAGRVEQREHEVRRLPRRWRAARRRCGSGRAGRPPARSSRGWRSSGVCRIHTLWSFSTPWMNTTVGLAASKALPPV